GFAGTVVSDYWAVPFLATMHRVAADPADAGGLALAAGVDVELPDTIGFAGLADRVPEEVIDRAVRRLLTQKVELGLLDPDWTPEGSVADAGRVDLDGAANRALARELAERSIVLLDPGSALPLPADLRRGASRRSCPARKAAVRSPVSCRGGSSRSGGFRCRSRACPAGSPAPTCSRRWGAPRARASAAWTPRRCSPSATAAPTPRSSWT